MSRVIGEFDIDDDLDTEGELEIIVRSQLREHLTRNQVESLRDHLNKILSRHTNKTPKLWYQRDNHTYSVLTERADPAEARKNLQANFDEEGFKWGMICANSGDIKLHMHGKIPDNIDCWLENACRELNKQTGGGA